MKARYCVERWTVGTPACGCWYVCDRRYDGVEPYKRFTINNRDRRYVAGYLLRSEARATCAALNAGESE